MASAALSAYDRTRFVLDAERARALRGHLDVQRAQQYVAKNPSADVRRSLLASALRLTPALAPAICAQVQACRARLEVAAEVEVYVYPAAQFNAGCTAPDGGRVYVLLSSALVDAFTGPELDFVIGHELGHHIFAHHEIPAHILLDGQRPDPALALELFAWQRCAEISADRAGLWCAQALAPAAQAMFKLTSGVASARLALDLPSFLQQADELLRAPEAVAHEDARRDWLATHPFSPLRVRALAEAMRGQAFEGAAPMADIDAVVAELLSAMDPRYTHEQSEGAEAMRRLLFAAAVAVATAPDDTDGSGGTVAPAERAAIERLLGQGALPLTLDHKAILETLPARMERVRALAPALKRHALIRDLAVIAAADGRTSDRELVVIGEVATGLGVPVSVVTAAVASAVRPLD